MRSVFCGTTLYHIDELLFKLDEMPLNYGSFEEKIQSLEIWKTIAALDQVTGLPSRGDVEPGEIPALMDLGWEAMVCIQRGTITHVQLTVLDEKLIHTSLWSLIT